MTLELGRIADTCSLELLCMVVVWPRFCFTPDKRALFWRLLFVFVYKTCALLFRRGGSLLYQAKAPYFCITVFCVHKIMALFATNIYFCAKFEQKRPLFGTICEKSHIFG